MELNLPGVVAQQDGGVRAGRPQFDHGARPVRLMITQELRHREREPLTPEDLRPRRFGAARKRGRAGVLLE